MYEQVASFGKKATTSSSILTMVAYTVNTLLAVNSANVLTIKKDGTYRIITTVFGYDVGPMVRYKINNGSWTQCSSTSIDAREVDITLSKGDTITFSLYSGSTNGPMGGMAQLVRIV